MEDWKLHTLLNAWDDHCESDNFAKALPVAKKLRSFLFSSSNEEQCEIVARHLAQSLEHESIWVRHLAAFALTNKGINASLGMPMSFQYVLGEGDAKKKVVEWTNPRSYENQLNDYKSWCEFVLNRKKQREHGV